jgi:hypothetical protein
MVVREHASLNIFKRVDKYYVTALIPRIPPFDNVGRWTLNMAANGVVFQLLSAEGAETRALHERMALEGRTYRIRSTRRRQPSKDKR